MHDGDRNHYEHLHGNSPQVIYNNFMIIQFSLIIIYFL